MYLQHKIHEVFITLLLLQVQEKKLARVGSIVDQKSTSFPNPPAARLLFVFNTNLFMKSHKYVCGYFWHR